MKINFSGTIDTAMLRRHNWHCKGAVS